MFRINYNFSDLKDQCGIIVADKFSELACAYWKTAMFMTTLKYLWLDPPARNSQNSGGNSHAKLAGLFDVCLELKVIQKNNLVL